MDRSILSARAATLLNNKTPHGEVEKYALEVYDNWSSKPKWLAMELTDYEDSQYCQELIQALRDESWNRLQRTKLKRLQLEDKLLGTSRAEKLKKQQKHSGYCCLKDELRALDKEAAERPKSYVIDGNIYYRDEALELYKEFRDMLISLDWAGKQDLGKVPTEYLARWMAAMQHILSSEELLKLYTEDMPETKGGKARYGVCPECGELLLLDEGRDNICPMCDALVLRNQLIPKSPVVPEKPKKPEVLNTYTEGDYTVTVLSTVAVEQDEQDPALFGTTDYNNQWHDLGSDVSYEHMFRDTVDEDIEL